MHEHYLLRFCMFELNNHIYNILPYLMTILIKHSVSRSSIIIIDFKQYNTQKYMEPKIILNTFTQERHY